MAIRGVYSKGEQEWLAEVMKWKGEEEWLEDEPTRDEASGGSGTAVVVWRVATKELIRIHASGTGDRNPLWLDEEYAKKTRWSCIIAPPFFVHVISLAGGQGRDFMFPLSLGITSTMNAGSAFEFFQPIKVNDGAFKVKQTVISDIKDVTRLDGKGPHQWLLLSDKTYINQRDEVVAIATGSTFFILLPHPKEGEVYPVLSTQPRVTEYKYTKEELEAADRTYDEEEIRGANPRYWEDVVGGDQLKPVINGPITLWDQVIHFAAKFGGLGFTTRETIRFSEPQWVVTDPVTGVRRWRIEQHLFDRVGQMTGAPMAYASGIRLELHLGKLITNWMGDDGFLKRYDGQNRRITLLGDTVWCRGKVIKKHVENGEHLVDLAVWGESIRGWINTIATATVALPSRSVGGEPMEISESGIKVGDRVRIKDRPEWPSGYKLANSEGVVVEVKEPAGFVVIHLEKTNAALDIGTSLVLRVEGMQKI